MFGYIFPDKPELKVKEYELFRAYYCGLCKAIGANCGQTARFALNYDSAFLGLFLSSIDSKSEAIKVENCLAHPFNKRPAIKESNVLKYAADINIILAYYKLKDDFNDAKSIKYLSFMGILYNAFFKAKRRNLQKESIIKYKLNELSELEKQGCKSVDMAAEPFARLTEEIFAYTDFDDKNTEKKLRWFGYNIGKWIYILDAFDDIDKDIKNKNYNPLLKQFCYNNEKADVFKDNIKENISFTLTYTLSEVGKAYELLDIKKNREIIENIIYGGMYKKTLQILAKRS